MANVNMKNPYVCSWNSNYYGWHNKPFIELDDDSYFYVSVDTQTGDYSLTVKLSHYTRSGWATGLQLAAGVKIDGQVYLSSHKKFSFGSSSSYKTGNIGSVTFSKSGNLGNGTHTFIAIADCNGTGSQTACDTDTGQGHPYDDEEVSDAYTVTVNKATKPKKPSPSISYPTQTVNQNSNHKGSASWIDNCFNGTTAKKGYYDYSFQMRTNSLSTWYHVHDGTSTGSSAQFDSPYPASPGNQIRIVMHAHTQQGLDGDEASSQMTYPALSKSASVAIASSSKDKNMYVRGNYEAKASVSGLACNVDLASSRYKWVIRFYDSRGNTKTKVNANNSNTSMTAAISPYSELGSRHGDTLYAEVKLYLRYNTYTYTGTSNYSTSVSEVLIDTKTVNLGKLVDFYVKMITPSTNKWCKVYSVTTSGTKEVPYDRFKTK